MSVDLSAPQKTLASSYAALLLHDCGLTATATNIAAILKSAKINTDLATNTVFERVLKDTPITNFIGCVGGSAASIAPAAASAPAVKKEAPKVEEPKEEEADMDMGDLFG